MNGFRDWLTSAFGADGGRAVQMVLALVLVVGLLLVLAWVFRRLFGGGLAGHKGGRLSVLDSAHVDGRRRLILLRRDDVEHLVMIGGPNDLLVESRIIRGAPVVAQGAMMPRGAPASAPRQTRGDEAEARPAIEDRGEGASGSASKIGAMASMGAAVAGAGAFLKSKTAKSAAAEAPADTRRTVDQAFDAPLGREARGPARDVPPAPASPPVPPAAMPEPIELPLAPVGGGAQSEGSGRRTSVPPMPPQAAMRGPMAPKPPVVEAPPKVAPVPPMPPVVEPVAVPVVKDAEVVAAVIPPKQPPAEVVVPPVAAKPVAKTIDDIDLLSELNLGIEELIRIEPKPIASAPTKTAVTAPPVVPTAPAVVVAPAVAAVASTPVVVEAAQVPVEPPKKKPVVPPVAPPVAPPEGIDRLEFLFEEAMFAEPGKDTPIAPPQVPPAVVAATEDPSAAPVLGPAVEPVLETAEAPEVLPADEPAPAAPRRQPVDELEEEMARLLAEISGQPKR